MEVQYESLKKFPEGISKSFLYTVFRFCGNSNKNRLMPRRKLIFFFLFHLIRRSRKSKKSEPFNFQQFAKAAQKHKKMRLLFLLRTLRKDILCLKTPFLQTLSAANVTAVWIASIFCIFGASAKKHFRYILSKTTVFAYTTLQNAAKQLHPTTLRRWGLSPLSIKVSDVGISPPMMAITFTISNA